MRTMIAYERSGGARGGGAAGARSARASALLLGMRKLMASFVDEILRIPDYIDEAERLRQGLRRAHSNSRERDRGGARPR